MYVLIVLKKIVTFQGNYVISLQFFRLKGIVHLGRIQSVLCWSLMKGVSPSIFVQHRYRYTYHHRYRRFTSGYSSDLKTGL